MLKNFYKTSRIILGFKYCIDYIELYAKNNSFNDRQIKKIKDELLNELDNLFNSCLAYNEESTTFYMLDNFDNTTKQKILEGNFYSIYIECDNKNELQIIDVINKNINAFTLINSTFQLASIIDIITGNIPQNLHRYYIDIIYKSIMGVRIINIIFNILRNNIRSKKIINNLDQCICKCWDIIVNESYDTVFVDIKTTTLTKLIIPEKVIFDSELFIKTINFDFLKY